MDSGHLLDLFGIRRPLHQREYEEGRYEDGQTDGEQDAKHEDDGRSTTFGTDHATLWYLNIQQNKFII